MNESQISGQMKEWLEKKENIELLRQISGKCIPEIEKRALARVIFMDVAPSHEEKIHEVLSCLFQFLAENRRIHYALISGEGNKTALIKRSFIHHLTDQARLKDSFRKVYRNAQAAVRSSDTLDVRTKENSALCLCFKGRADGRPVFLTSDDLKEIAFPGAICRERDYERVNRKKILAPLAEYFLEQAGGIAGIDCPCIPLNLFIEWLRLHVVFSAVKDASEILDNKSRDGLYHGEASACAGAFSNRLSFEEKWIFFMFHCKGLTHAEAAFEYGNKSNLSYHKAKVEQKLRKLLEPFAWYRDDSSFRHFRKSVCRDIEAGLEARGTEAVYKTEKYNK